MKLIEVAREQKDLLNEGIAYIAVWQVVQKNGKRSWFTEDIFPDGGVEKDEPVFSEEQKSRLTEIAAIDENAILLNGYIHSWIGSADEPLNAASIAVGIEKHYAMHNALVKDYLAGEDEADEADSPATEDETDGADLADAKDEAELSAESDFEAAQNEPRDEREELGLGRTRRESFQGENGMRANDVPDTITIELPAVNVKPEILTALLNSKSTLIEAALGEDCSWEREYATDGLHICDLPIEFDHRKGTVRFEWLRFGADSDAVAAWSAFLAAAVKFSKSAKRVTAKDAPAENEKFAFRTFMVRIGMNDAENRAYRRYLLRNLNGDSAFATAESKAKWVAKHGVKKSAEEAEADV